MPAATYATGTITFSGNVAEGSVEVSINNISFTYTIREDEPNPDGDAAAEIFFLIAASSDPAISGVVTAALDDTVVTIYSVVAGTVGNSIPMSTLTPATVLLSGATLSGGVDATPDPFVPSDNSEELLFLLATRS
jgi:phage tail sheath gpL-like